MQADGRLSPWIRAALQIDAVVAPGQLPANHFVEFLGDPAIPTCDAAASQKETPHVKEGGLYSALISKPGCSVFTEAGRAEAGPDISRPRRM